MLVYLWATIQVYLPPVTPAPRIDVSACIEPVCCVLGMFGYLRQVSLLNLLSLSLLYILIEWNL